MADRTVRVRLEAVTSQYKAAMAEAGVATKGLDATVESLSARGSKSLSSLTGGLVDVTGGTAAAAAGFGVAALALLKFTNAGIDSYVKLVEQVDAYQDVTGSSAEQSSKMVAIANAFGVEVDTLAMSMFRLSKNISAHSDVLAADGVVIARTKDGQVDLSTTLGNVADAYQRAGAGVAGNKVLTDAFGRSGLRLIDVLERTHGEIDAVTEAAARHHQIVSDEEIEKVRQYQVSTRELGEAWSGLERELGADVVPRLAELATVMTSIIDRADDLATHVGGWGTVIDTVTNAIPGVNELKMAVDFLVPDTDEASKAARDHAEALQAEADAAAEDAAEISEFAAGLKSLVDHHFAVQEANDKLEAQLIGFADSTRAAQISGDKWATTLQAGTIQGNRNREALRGMAQGAFDVAEKMKGQHATQDQINVAMIVYRERLMDTLTQLGFNRQEVGNYIDTLLQIPGNLGTVITADTAQAEAALARVLAVLGAIQRAEHFTNLNVLSGRTATPAAPPTAGTGLGDALGGRGPAATSARDAAASNAGGAAKDAAAEAAAWKQAADENERNLFEHHQRTLAEYTAYLSGRMAQERQFSAEWFALLDERQRILDQHAEDERTWNEALARNQAENIKLWMDTLARQNEVGDLSNADYLKMLQDRLAGLERYSDEWMATWRQINQIEKASAEESERVAQERADAEKRRAEAAAKRRTEAFGRLNSLLDDEQRLRKQQETLLEQHRQKLDDIEAAFFGDQGRILDARRTQLLGWAKIDQQTVVSWGNSVSALASNVHDQIGIFDEWADALAAIRERGVSEEVIGLLGLDEGPQALGQLRMFTSATEDEIADLNAAVAERTAQAGDRVSAEAEDSYSKVASSLYDLASKHAAEVEKLTEEFLASEQAMTDQLATIGDDAGRSYGQAIADGLASTIPSIREAAEAADRALRLASRAKGDAVTGRNPGNLKDVAGGKNVTDFGAFLRAALGQNKAPNVTVMVGNKVITDQVKVVVDGMARDAQIAGVS